MDEWAHGWVGGQVVTSYSAKKMNDRQKQIKIWMSITSYSSKLKKRDILNAWDVDRFFLGGR